ncbi:GNAT family N-acetyltransferase [Leuconostocaceae bacterium ESL0723]|nr:GNAT family N-acetyltransferase [Leuconostocaceae bacterium ESL0723]
MTVQIRPATVQDLPKMTAIYNESIKAGKITADLKPQTPAERRPWFDEHQGQEKYPLFGVYQDGELVGYGYLSAFNTRKAYAMTAEVSYYLDMAARGHGIGSQLLSFLMDYAKKQGIEVLVALVFAENARSNGLLLKYGFSSWGKLPQVAKGNDGDWLSLEYMGKRLV